MHNVISRVVNRALNTFRGSEQLLISFCSTHCSLPALFLFNFPLWKTPFVVFFRFPLSSLTLRAFAMALKIDCIYLYCIYRIAQMQCLGRTFISFAHLASGVFYGFMVYFDRAVIVNIIAQNFQFSENFGTWIFPFRPLSSMTFNELLFFLSKCYQLFIGYRIVLLCTITSEFQFNIYDYCQQLCSIVISTLIPRTGQIPYQQNCSSGSSVVVHYTPTPTLSTDDLYSFFNKFFIV